MSDYARVNPEIDGTTGTLTVGGAGVEVCLESIHVNTAAASAVVTVYKGTDTTGSVLMTIDASTARSLHIDGVVLGGIHVTVTGGAAKVTVVAG